MKKLLKGAVTYRKGRYRRAYMAEVPEEFPNGNARQAERVFGWGRGTVVKGLRERATGIACQDHSVGRGNRKSEKKWPQLEADIRALVDPVSQADPTFQTPFAFPRITAKAVRQAFIDEKGDAEPRSPVRTPLGIFSIDWTIGSNAFRRSRPAKKNPETDAIFANIATVDQELQDNPQQYRVPIDTKAKLVIGDCSRRGKTRVAAPEPALDHGVESDETFVPVGISEPGHAGVTIFFSTSIETTDLIVDCLERWWEDNRGRLAHITELILNVDNGPHVQSRRRQFIKRFIEFADDTGLIIHLVYYPPYHSKYNSIDRCWGILEAHWNGTLLNSIRNAIEWTKTMTWKGVNPVVHLLKKVYKTGGPLTDEEMEICEVRLERSKTLSKWDVRIQPAFG